MFDGNLSVYTPEHVENARLLTLFWNRDRKFATHFECQVYLPRGLLCSLPQPVLGSTTQKPRSKKVRRDPVASSKYRNGLVHIPFVLSARTTATFPSGGPTIFMSTSPSKSTERLRIVRCVV